MKNCLIFLVVKEKQIKTMTRFHLILVRMPIIKNKQTNKKPGANHGENMEKKEPLYTLGGKLVQ